MAKFLSKKPDTVENVENAIIAEYSKYFEKDKMFWTKLIGNIIGDTSFVVPSLTRANFNFGLLDKLKKSSVTAGLKNNLKNTKNYLLSRDI